MQCVGTARTRGETIYINQYKFLKSDPGLGGTQEAIAKMLKRENRYMTMSEIYDISKIPKGRLHNVLDALTKRGVVTKQKVLIHVSPERNPICKITEKQVLNLHRKGLTDKEISEKLGVTQAAVNFRRQRLGLKNNYWEK